MDLSIIASIFLHLVTLFPEQSLGLSGPQCDVDLYPKPYVRVVKKRNGPPLEALDRSGFIDLTKFIHKILCINGPAVLYSDVIHTGKPNEKRVFTMGNVAGHSHECIIINQISTEKAIELRDAGIDNPTMDDISPSDIIGTRATGIYLVSEPDDYFLGSSVMFRQQNWDYIVIADDKVDDGSFVTVGKGPFCVTVNDKFDIILDAKDVGENMLCKWTYNNLTASPDFKRRYEKIFDGSFKRQDFIWHDCSGGSGGAGLGPFPSGLGINTDPPVNIITFDPFAIIDPQFLSSKGSKLVKSKFLNGSVKAAASSKFNIGINTNIRNSGGGGGGNVPGPDDDMDDLIIQLDKSMCESLPPKLKDKPADCTDVDKDAGCAILGKAAMTVKDPPVNPDPDELEPELKWKKEIMDISAEIFGKICEPFPPEMPFTIARVMEYYLVRAHKANTAYRKDKLPVWDFLMSELRRCNQGIKTPMLWYWDNQEEVVTPDPVEPTICKVSKCSDGCKPSANEKMCEPENTQDMCDTSPIECTTDECKYDEALHECQKDGSTTQMSGPCDPIETPKCQTDGCIFNEKTFICDIQIVVCKVTECNDPTACAIKSNTCENTGKLPGGNGGGANPSDTGGSGGGSGGGGGGPSPTPPNPTPTPPPATFVKPHNQEVFREKTGRNYDFNGFPVNVLVITNIIKKVKAVQGRTITKQTDDDTTVLGECLFYYEDMAETDYELNIAIDIHWKIWATVIGYCNNFYQIRKSETFPRLYNTYYEDFFQLVVDDWKYPKENNDLKYILSEFNSEKSQKWLDVCLESSYYVSNSSTFRPPRPLTIGNSQTPQSNYFLQLPDFIAAKFHQIDIANPNETIKCQ